MLSALLQLLVFTTVPFLWWLCTAREKENFFKWIGLKKPLPEGSIFKLLLLVAAGILVYGLSMNLLVSFFMSDVSTATSAFEGRGFSATVDILAYAVIQTGLSEEILFRGFLGKRLINKMGFSAGNGMQALLFGLMHGIPFGLVTGNIAVALIFTLVPGLMGWLEGWINEKKCNGSIVPGWVMHSVMNICAAATAAFML